jgi:hypothetical protein
VGDRNPPSLRRNHMKGRVTAIAFLLALAIPAAAGAASSPTIEPTSLEYPNLALKADSNEVAVEGVISPRNSASSTATVAVARDSSTGHEIGRVMDVDGVI